MAEDGFREEYLGGNIRVLVSGEHLFGTDAILLSSFAGIKRKEKVCDLGTGCGILPLLWCRDGGCSRIAAVEIQENACMQFSSSLELNGLADKIDLYNRDLKDVQTYLERGSFDAVTCNPPYYTGGSGPESPNESLRIARHEIFCTMADVAESAAYLLKFGGRLCICNRPERLSDVLYAMKINHIEPKRLRMAAQKEGAEPWLILVEGRKNGNPGMKIEKQLIMQNTDGTYTEEIKRMYGDYAAF